MKAIKYHRVSSTLQKERESIENQYPITHEIAVKNGYEVIDSIDDDGRSGTILEFRKFSNLIDNLDSGKVKIDVLVVSDVDRLFREDCRFNPTGNAIIDEERKNHVRKSMQDVAVIRAALVTNQIKIHDRRGIHSPDSLTFNIENVIATNELNKFRERSDNAKIRKLKEGKLFFPKPPYGYRFKFDDKKKTGIVVDENEAKDLIFIYETIGKVGVTAAIDVLNEAKIKTPWDRANFKNRENAKWKSGSLDNFIRNIEKYRTGKFPQSFKGVVVVLELPPLLPDELYLRVIKAKWRRKPASNRKVYLSTGLVKCSCKGYINVLTGTTVKNQYAVCRNCNGRTRLENFERHLWQSTVIRLLQITLIDNQALAENGNDIEEKISAIKTKLTSNQEAQNRLGVAVAVANGLSVEAMINANIPLLEEKQKLKLELLTLKKMKLAKEQNREQAKDLVSLGMENLKKSVKAKTLEERRELIQSVLIGKVRILVRWDELGLTLGFPPVGSLNWLWLHEGDDMAAIAFANGVQSTKTLEIMRGFDFLIRK